MDRDLEIIKVLKPVMFLTTSFIVLLPSKPLERVPEIFSMLKSATVDWYLLSSGKISFVVVHRLVNVEVKFLFKVGNFGLQSRKTALFCLLMTDETCWMFSAAPRWITSANLHTSTSRWRVFHQKNIWALHKHISSLYYWLTSVH